MPFLLLVLGVLTAGTGAVMVGFGVPINEFSLGNTLIIAGTTALVGGLIVIALAVATRHLVRIAGLLRAQPAARPARSVEGHDTPASPGPGRLPFPLRPSSQEGSPRNQDSRFSPPSEAPTDPIFERLRMSQPGAQAHRSAEPPMLAEEEAPLSPRAPRIPFPAEPAHNAAPERAPRPSDKSRNGAPAPAVPAPQPRMSFNDAWPSEQRPDPQPQKSAESAPHANGDALRSALQREFESAPVSILKSGVVDGMAYTLYTDGSIEAELAQGVVRFGSIEELRNHLEKSA